MIRTRILNRFMIVDKQVPKYVSAIMILNKLTKRELIRTAILALGLSLIMKSVLG